MARILFALDLGGGYGHMTRVLPLADILAARGHEIVLALRLTDAPPPMLAPRPYRVVAAPVWAGGDNGAPPAECYADVLLRTGYAVPGVLDHLLRRWLDLFASERPDLVITEFAPTAALAAQLSGRPHAMTGCGYTLPPRTRPMPRMRRWVQVPAARIAVSEARVLAIINQALTGLGGRPLEALEQSLAADATFLCTFPETDHYGAREGAAYYGNAYESHVGVAPAWLPGAGRLRAFAYLRAGATNFLPVLQALEESGVQTLLHARGLTPALRDALPRRHLAVSDQPVRIAEAMAACTFVVCHSPNTAAAALVAGRPVLMLPEHVEQSMAADRLASQDLAIALPVEASAGHCAAALRALLDQPRHTAAARRFAAHYHGYDPTEAVAAIAEICEELL